jgi:hypothetical protein
LHNSLKVAIAEQSEVMVTEVYLDTLDNQILIHDLPKPDFVKIDVQGLELDVLMGMTKTIEKCLFVRHNFSLTLWNVTAMGSAYWASPPTLKNSKAIDSSLSNLCDNISDVMPVVLVFSTHHLILACRHRTLQPHSFIFSKLYITVCVVIDVG